IEVGSRRKSRRISDEVGGIDKRSPAAHVCSHVVVLVFVGNAEAAANDSLVFAQETLEYSRCPGKTHNRTKVMELIRHLPHRGSAQRKRSIPERVGTGLLGHGKIVQEIHSLAIPFPAQAEVQSQIVFYAPVVLEIEGKVVFLERQNVRSLGDAGELRLV